MAPQCGDYPHRRPLPQGDGEPSALPQVAASIARKPIAMRFNGRVIEAYAGDTVASALLANGIHFVGRSFKYHRPRGIFSHGCRGAERAALGRSRRESRRSEQPGSSIEAVDGLSRRLAEPLAVARLRCRRRSTTCCRRCSPPASTTRPSCGRGRFWDRLYEPWIRAAAGLGRAPAAPDPDRYQHRHAHCDVLVVGAGPAGLAAALAASRRRQARHPRRRAGRDGRRAAARVDLQHRRQVGLGVARRTRSPLSARATTSPCCRARPPSATTITTTSAWCSASGRSPAAAAPGPAARAAVAGAGGRGRAGDGRARAPARLRRQRSARHHAGREPARVRQPLRRGAGSTCRRSPRRALPPIRLRRISGAAGLEVAVVDPAPGERLRVGGRGLARRRLRGPDRAHGRRIARAQARHRPDRRSRRRIGGDRHSAHPAMRLRRPVRRLDAGGASVLAVAGQARASMRPSTPSYPGRPCRPSARPAPPRAPTSSQACLEEGWAAGAAAAGRAERARLQASASRTGFRPVAHHAGLRRPAARPRLRRPAERRHRRGYRPCGARGLRGDRARQALHHHRHGDGPGQDLQHGRPGPGRRGAGQAGAARSARRRSGRPIRP